jgi:hypothetical protein
LKFTRLQKYPKSEAIELVSHLVEFNAEKRWSINQVLQHHLVQGLVYCEGCGDFSAKETSLSCGDDEDSHYLCREQAENWVNSFILSGIEEWKKNKGMISCSVCERLYSVAELFKIVSAELFEKYDDARLRALKLIASEDEWKKAQLEIERFKRASVFEREVEQHVLEIAQYANPRCPRCKVPFADFSNCAAITCNCGCQFCAWCLNQCKASEDHHRHVVDCPENQSLGRNVFVQPNISRWSNYMQEKLSRNVSTRIEAIVSAEVREAVRQRLITNNIGILPQNPRK